MNCKYEVPGGTLQKDLFKEQFDALEFKINDFETLILELTHSNLGLALHLLLRLRGGESIQDLVQDVSNTDSRVMSLNLDSHKQYFPYMPMPIVSVPLANPTLFHGSGSSEP
jgi:hypothetical protein